MANVSQKCDAKYRVRNTLFNSRLGSIKLTHRRLILTYLIPCHLLTTHTLPSAQLLQRFPRLQKLFLPLAHAIRRGNLHEFDVALQEGEDEFIKRRIYLTLERGRDIALRNLLRKVFIAGGYEEAKDGAAPVRRTRVPVAEFAAAMKVKGGGDIDTDEVECLLANMIYKVCFILSFRSSRNPRHEINQVYTGLLPLYSLDGARPSSGHIRNIPSQPYLLAQSLPAPHHPRMRTGHHWRVAPHDSQDDSLTHHLTRRRTS